MDAWTTWVEAAPYLGVVGLLVALLIYRSILKGDAGSEAMTDIADAIHDGAMAFLKREYSILLIFIAAVFILLYAGIGAGTSLAFLGGAACSIVAGYSGAPVSQARRAAPSRSRGSIQPVRERLPSGKMPTISPSSTSSRALS